MALARKFNQDKMICRKYVSILHPYIDFECKLYEIIYFTVVMCNCVMISRIIQLNHLSNSSADEDIIGLQNKISILLTLLAEDFFFAVDFHGW